MASNDWPKRRTERQDGTGTIYCVVCHKPITAGQLYHYVTHKGRKFVHVKCYEKEVRGHDTAGA